MLTAAAATRIAAYFPIYTGVLLLPQDCWPAAADARTPLCTIWISAGIPKHPACTPDVYNIKVVQWQVMCCVGRPNCVRSRAVCLKSTEVELCASTPSLA